MSEKLVIGRFSANDGIVGLGPYDEVDGWPWPSEGYDADLFKHHRYTPQGYREENQIFAISGHTKQEWLDLAELMMERWKMWRGYIATLPDDPSV